MAPDRPSRLESRLRAGAFTLTAELAPPRGTDTERSVAAADRIAPLVDAFNVTDNQNARLRLSPVAFGHLLAERGHEVILQVTCRDRNRLAIQSDLLGAWRLGLRNLLALTGDHMGSGDHPGAKPVFDLDSLTLIRTVGPDGRRIRPGGPPAWPGRPPSSAARQSPAISPLAHWRCCASARRSGPGRVSSRPRRSSTPASVVPFVEMARGEGVFLLGGIFILHSRKVLDHIVTKVPGLRVPDDVLQRLNSAGDVVAEGVAVAAETLRELSGTVPRRPHHDRRSRRPHPERSLEQSGGGRTGEPRSS